MDLARDKLSRLCVLLIAFSGLAACANTGLVESRYLSPTPNPIEKIRLAYISDVIRIDYSRTRPLHGQYFNEVQSYGYVVEAMAKLELNKVDDKVARLSPAILRAHGLRGDVTTFVTPYRLMEVLEASRKNGKADADTFWLVLAPTSAERSMAGIQVQFQASMLDPLADKAYWTGAYVMSVNNPPIRDEDVQHMLAALMQGLTQAR